MENKKIIYHNDKITVSEFEVKTSLGNIKKSICIDKPDYCQILAFTPDKKIIFVKQWKIGPGVVHELPAGHIEEGEDPVECIKRELLEETGYVAKNIQLQFCCYVSPGVLCNKVYGFIGYDAVKVQEPNYDEDEKIETILVDNNFLEEIINDNRIKTDLSSLTLIYRSHHMFSSKF